MSALYGEGLAIMDAEYSEVANGHSAPPPFNPPPQRRMPVRTKRVNLEGDYEGWWAEIRTNAPFGVYLNMMDMLGGDADDADNNMKVARAMGELVNTLPQLVRDWNFVDEEGEPLPCDLRGMKRLPQDLLLELVGKMTGGTDGPKSASA